MAADRPVHRRRRILVARLASLAVLAGQHQDRQGHELVDTGVLDDVTDRSRRTGAAPTSTASIEEGGVAGRATRACRRATKRYQPQRPTVTGVVRSLRAGTRRSARSRPTHAAQAGSRSRRRYAATAMTAKDKLRQAVEELPELEAEDTLAYIAPGVNETPCSRPSTTRRSTTSRSPRRKSGPSRRGARPTDAARPTRANRSDKSLGSDAPAWRLTFTAPARRDLRRLDPAGLPPLGVIVALRSTSMRWRDGPHVRFWLQAAAR